VPERVLVFAPNWLGDAVMALPAVAAMRQAWPGASLDVAARGAVAPLFSLVPEVARTVVLAPGTASAAQLREGRYDTAVLFTNSFHTAKLARAAGIPERWGYAADLRSWLLTKAVPRPLRLHQVDYYRALVDALGCPSGVMNPELRVPEPLRAEGAALLAQAGWDGRTPLIALAPGAAFGSAKRWPAAAFAALSERILADGATPALIGTPADRAAGAEVAAALRGTAAPLDLIGRTSIPQLAGVFMHCRALVTNDSGAMHLAAALGLDLTVMFGPTREHETYPRGAGRHAFLTNPVWCRPCMLRECPLTHRCMTGISVDAVHAATRAPR
jgi:heptosyltransferase-2